MAKKQKKAKTTTVAVDQLVIGSLNYSLYRELSPEQRLPDHIEFHGELCFALGERNKADFDKDGRINKKLFEEILADATRNNPSMYSLTNKEEKELWEECLNLARGMADIE